MPITPFHLGVGLLFKGVFPAQFSLIVFTISQVIIDLEPAIYMILGEWPVHRLFHTYIGATLVTIISVVAGHPLGALLIRFWNAHLSTQQQWLAIHSIITWQNAVVGAVFGSFSHIILDSIMHSDVHPYIPFNDSNGMLSIVSVNLLHTFLLVSGIAGLMVLIACRIRYQR